jgi:hypothetical protein
MNSVKLPTPPPVLSEHYRRRHGDPTFLPMLERTFKGQTSEEIVGVQDSYLIVLIADQNDNIFMGCFYK